MNFNVISWLYINYYKFFLCRTKFVHNEGTTYRCRDVVILNINECNIPTFCVIEDIFIKDGMALLGLLSQEIVQFSEHYHSWIIQDQCPSQSYLTPIDSLYCRQSLYPRTISTAPSTFKFITLKYKI